MNFHGLSLTATYAKRLLQLLALFVVVFFSVPSTLGSENGGGERPLFVATSQWIMLIKFST